MSCVVDSSGYRELLGVQGQRSKVKVKGFLFFLNLLEQFLMELSLMAKNQRTLSPTGQKTHFLCHFNKYVAALLDVSVFECL